VRAEKRPLITGIVNRESVALATAMRAQLAHAGSSGLHGRRTAVLAG
jgi:hypothetical protein